MRRFCLLFLLLALLRGMSLAQGRFRVMTWNVENLFDARHDTLRHDEQFLPGAERQWTWGRYWRKVEDVARVIMGVGEDVPPALVALCEVENDSVMQALTRRSSLRSVGYAYVMTDSPDLRGIDVALMYQPLQFRLLGHESLRVPSAQYGLRPTRDLLHVWGRVPSGDTLHVAVCHLPSRIGGREGRQNRRLAVAVLRRLADSLLAVDPHCRLLVMGDFNATLRDKSLRPLLTTTSRNPAPARQPLLPLTPNSRRPTSGTYRFRGNWSWIDHMLVTPALADRCAAARIYVQPWMQRPLADGTWYPRRTYMGTRYAAGVSDHLPIFSDITW